MSLKAEDLFVRTLSEVLRIFPRIRELLGDDPDFHVLLRELRKSLSVSEKAYYSTGAYRLCADCAIRERSTCCGRDMELSVSRELLILNLFLGVTFPEKRTFARGCFFLTLKGCSLKARPIICRNFFCAWFREHFPHEKLIFLQKAQEDEMTLVFQLEVFLKEKLFFMELR
ncbi:hypothetical protein [Thermosulfurimonas sp. F29]|uniref:hypothetical protein n=1 Tax=Thermosulfurimonas sp. F29 TaxID=2867247 RepID=UPI001C832221|nr:hypothetical protein [Thermosulfurimonas sp. F29]MBX6422108.1 hypothetical protein [Thermosulfurimonas sp. F29]